MTLLTCTGNEDSVFTVFPKKYIERSRFVTFGFISEAISLPTYFRVALLDKVYIMGHTIFPGTNHSRYENGALVDAAVML